MNRFPKFSFIALIAAVCACGGDNFSETAEPELTIEGSFIELRMPSDEDKNLTQDPLIIRNTGDGPLEIKSIEWLDRPDRLIPLLGRGDGCDGEGSCEGAADLEGNPLNDPVCLTATNTCNGTGFPATPFELGPQLRQDLEFLIADGPRELDCPSPSEGVVIPSTIDADDYCGALRITTNAFTDSADGVIVEGIATIYFLAPEASSGIIAVDPNTIEFNNVSPGFTDEVTVNVTNNGDQPLEIDNISIDQNNDWFEFVGIDDDVPTSIDPSQGKAWTVRINVPQDAQPEELDFTTTLEIDSGAGNAAQGIIALSVTSGSGDAPVIDLSEETLSFDAQATQTVTVTNTGSATLLISGLDVKPASADVFYTITVDGQPLNMSLPIPKDSSAQIEVAFSRPNGNTDSSTAILEINHNDAAQGQVSEIVLLGDEGNVPFGQVFPSTFTFFAEDGNNESRDFVIRNIGTAALDITNVMWMFSVGDNSEFILNNAQGSIAPGDIRRVSVDFSGADATQDVGIAIFESNNASQLELAMRALPSNGELPVPAIEAQFSGNASVGAPAGFSANGSTPASAVNRGRWTLLARPAGSTAFVSTVGSDIAFTPDTAGTYTLGLVINEQEREAQTTFDFVAE